MKLLIYYETDFQTDKHPAEVKWEDLPANIQNAVKATGSGTIVFNGIEHSTIAIPKNINNVL